MYTFHHYYLTAHLSRKSRHDTYLAYSVDEPDYRVVLKVFDAECIAPGITLNDFRQMETRLQSLKHPHIVAVRELGIEQGRPYLVSEYHARGSLRQYLEQRASGALSLEEAVGIVMQVGQATVFAHAHGVLHLAIRPENILLDDQGRALLADFRMSSLIDEARQQSNSERHVVSYLAPEQVIGAASEASDQYALGCLLYELVTGMVPDPPLLRQHATLNTLVASTTLPILPRQIEAVVLRTLAMKPRERYHDVATLLAELKSAVQPEPPAFPFAHLTAQYQPPSSLSERDSLGMFPSLPPISPSTAQVPQDEHSSQELPARSLEAFLTMPEWNGSSLLDRLAVVDGQEDMFISSGAFGIDALPKERLPTSRVREQEVDETDPSAFLDLLQDLRDDDTAPPANGVSDTPMPLLPPAFVSNDNPSISPGSPPSASSSHASTQLRPRRRNVPALCLLALLIVVIALFFSPFHVAITGMIWHAPAATPSIAQVRPTTMPTLKPTTLPTPTPTAMPTPIPTTIPVRSRIANPAPAAQPTPTPTPSAGSVQINAGGTGIGGYSADTDYTSGSVWSTSNTVNTSGVSDPAPEGVYQTSRYGYDFTYLIPRLIPGRAYMVRLHFAAMSWTQKGQNVFFVTINGNAVLRYFDINAAAGGTNIAVVKSFVAIARSDGTILMEFDATQGYVIVSGIQVLVD